jgi:hypothetical protein
LNGSLKDITIKFLRSKDYKLWRAEEAGRNVALQALISIGDYSLSCDRFCLNSSNELLRPYPTDASSEGVLYCLNTFKMESIVNNHPWLFSFIVAIETLPIAMSIASVNTNVNETAYPLVYVNKHFQWLVKYPREYIVGQKSSFFLQGSDIMGDGLTYENKLAKSVVDLSVVEGVFSTESLDEKIFRNYCISKPMSSRGCQCTYIITIHRNIDDIFSGYSSTKFDLKSFLKKSVGAKLIQMLPSVIPPF